MGVTADAGMAHAQLERLEREGKLAEGLRCEILSGDLVIRGIPRIRHEEAVAALFRHAVLWTQQHGGKAFTGAGIELGGHQLVPDLTLLGPDRIGELDEEGFHVPPDLVAEVTSPGTRSIDLVEKAAIYAEIGVAEYWVVDLARSRVVLHQRGADGTYDFAVHTEGTATSSVASDLQVPVVDLLSTR